MNKLSMGVGTCPPELDRSQMGCYLAREVPQQESRAKKIKLDIEWIKVALTDLEHYAGNVLIEPVSISVCAEFKRLCDGMEL
jgi:hypothetical protein